MLSDARLVRPSPLKQFGAPDLEWSVFATGQRHHSLRQAFGELLQGAQLRLPPSQIEAVAETIVDGALDGGSVDFISNVTAPFAWKLVQIALEFSDREVFEIQSSCSEIDPLFSTIEGYAAISSEAELSLRRIGEIAARSSLLDKGDASSIGVFLFGFHETVARLLANAVYCLLEHASTIENVSNLAANTTPLVDEVLRFMGPTTLVPRISSDAINWGEGTTLRRGDRVLLVVSAANRDREVFLDPNVFDPSRENADQHLSFGAGPHRCPASKLAADAASVFLLVLLKRWSALNFHVQNLGWRSAINSYGVEGLSISKRGV